MENTSRCHILIVEDHRDTALVFKQILAANYEVDAAFTIAEALGKCLQQSYALVICDIGLPDGHGISLLTAMRQFSKIRAIALTGYGSDEDIERCRRAGFDRHLTKPVSREVLEETVREVLGTAAE